MQNSYKQYEPFFGVWRIKREIGEGSYGKVFEAERTEYGVTYSAAIKVISVESGNGQQADRTMEEKTAQEADRGDKDWVSSVVNEMELMSKLKGNTNIVSYEDHQIIADENHRVLIMRMELLTPLKEYMKTHVFTEADAIRMGIDICRALELCEKKNIIHRDIKLENILVSDDGNFKLGDFGIAKTIEENVIDFSKKGTYSYMAPEVYKGQQYDSTVDLYSLGLVLYRIFNNNLLPFLTDTAVCASDEEKETALNRRISGEKFDPPVYAGEQVFKIIKKACAYHASDRYASAAEFRKALEKELRYADKEKDLLKIYKNIIDEDEPTSAAGDDEATAAEKGKTEQSEPERENTSEKTEVISKVIVDKPIDQKKKRSWKVLFLALCLIIAVAGTGIYAYLNRDAVVPEFVGISQTEAEELAEDVGLELEIETAYDSEIEKGIVISQNITEGESVDRNSRVKIVVSEGQEMICLDNYVGLKKEEAEELAEKAGIMLEYTEEYSEEVECGIVMEQDIARDTEIAKGTTVTLLISKGVEMTEVLDFSGKSQSEVVNSCKECGLEPVFIWDYSDTIEQGYVIGQDVAAGTSVKKGSSVMVTLSSGRKETGNTSVAVPYKDSPPDNPSNTDASPDSGSVPQSSTVPQDTSPQQPEDVQDVKQQEQDDLENILNEME